MMLCFGLRSNLNLIAVFLVVILLFALIPKLVIVIEYGIVRF